MTFVSYAQNYEDVLLWRSLHMVEHGCYIDVGAADPDEDNVTKAFYDAGWRGVNVEPMETFAAQLRRRRPDDVNLTVAVGAKVGERVFYEVWTQPDAVGQQKATGLSTLDPVLAREASDAGWDVRERRIEVTTLARICRDHTKGPTHILKIDVEGYEREVLSGADFTSFRPWVIVVESIHPGTRLPNHDEWASILVDADYHFVWFDGLNRFYVAAEQLGTLAQNFQTPPNLFDDFVRHDAAAAARLTEARAALAAEAAEAAALRNRLECALSERDQAAITNIQYSAELQQQAAKHEQRLAEAETEAVKLRESLAAARTEIGVLEHERAVIVGSIERLALELRWDQGPRALKMVLPVARLIRRSHRLVGSNLESAPVTQTTWPVTTAPAGISAVVSKSEPASNKGKDPPPGIPTRRWRRRLVLVLYRPFRPIIRPLAWRLRTFLTAELLRELRQLRDAEQQPRPPSEPSPTVDLDAFNEAANRLLLTLALEHRGNVDDHIPST